VDVVKLLEGRRRPAGGASAAAGGPRITHVSLEHMVRRFDDHVSTGGVRVPTRRQCVRCASQGYRKETTLYCPGCNVPLCVGESDCFYAYHVARVQMDDEMEG
jgi:hypothetical protein